MQSITYTESRLAEMMHSAGVRPTLQRIAIMSCVYHSTKHPSADDIYTELSPEYPSLSLTTVYNSLRALTAAGLLRTVDIDSGNMHYDMALQTPHSHFMCRVCGRIFDMEMPSDVCGGATPGFVIDCVDVYYKGVCPQCANIQNN